MPFRFVKCSISVNKVSDLVRSGKLHQRGDSLLKMYPQGISLGWPFVHYIWNSLLCNDRSVVSVDAVFIEFNWTERKEKFQGKVQEKFGPVK